VEKFAAGTLFPNQEENQADELEDMNGETTINDGDKVPMETLVHVLVQDGSHPAVGDDDVDDDCTVMLNNSNIIKNKLILILSGFKVVLKFPIH
jgi:hypothetical protein